jgi:hypothetical protein
VCDFARDERMRDDPDHFTAARERGIRNGAHEADAPATVDDSDAAFGKDPPDRHRRLQIRRVRARTRTAENANTHPERF